LLLAALLLSPFAAGAAPPCFPKLTPPSFQIVTEPNPELGEVVYSASPVGVVWGYTCQAADGKWWKVMAYGNWEQFPKDWLFVLDTAIRGTDADRRALWDKYATGTTIDSRLVPDWDMVAKLLPNPPPPPVVTEWKVLADPFRADKKRLVYNVVNGKRGTSTGQYIDAGQPCDPVTTITEYGAVYFLSVQGNPLRVARCTK